MVPVDDPDAEELEPLSLEAATPPQVAVNSDEELLQAPPSVLFAPVTKLTGAH